MPTGLQAGSPMVTKFLFLPPVLRYLLHKLNVWLGDYQRYLYKSIQVLPNPVYGLDPETGKELWRWSPPDWKRPAVAGDDEGLLDRVWNGQGPVCVPNPWASPSLDASGTVFLPHQSGHMYVLRDANGDGVVDGTEVSSHYTGSGFSHPGPALAPGLLAVADCDTLYVFLEQ